MKLLIVRIGAMGDVLHALPAAAALKRAMPGCRIGWAIEPRWRALLEDADGHRPVVDEVHLVDTRQWRREPASPRTLRSIARLRTELRSQRYDLCVDLQGSVKSALVARMAGAEQLVGPAYPRETPARWFYSRAVETRAIHVVEQAAELLGAACGVELRPKGTELPHDAQAEQWCDRLLATVATEQFALLVPQSGWGAKQWPADRFGAVAAALAEAGYTALVNASSAEDPLARAVVAAAGGQAHSVRCSIAELIALIRRTALVIAGDTGPLHLAAVLGRPVVALFGPTDPDRTGPFDTQARIFRHRSSGTDHRRHQTTEEGLLRIGTDEVAQAALELLQANAAGDSAL